MKLQVAGYNTWLHLMHRAYVPSTCVPITSLPVRTFHATNRLAAVSSESVPHGCVFRIHASIPAGYPAVRWYSSNRQGAHEPACVNLAGSAGSQAAQAATIGALTSAERAAGAAEYNESLGGEGQHGGAAGTGGQSAGQTAAEANRHDSNLSLHSAMQSSVPLPYSHDSKSPSHRNMPPAGGASAQGGHMQQDKFLYSDRQQGGEAVGGKEGEASRASPVGAVAPPLSQKERMKKAVKEYGATVIVFHTSISLCTLGIAYAAVSSGVDVVGLLAKAGVGQSILESKAVAGASTFVVAYAVHKVFAPLRMATTLTATPIIVHYLRRAGVLKAPPAGVPKAPSVAPRKQ